MADINHGLTEEHFQVIQKGLADADLALQRVSLAKQAGIDTGDTEQIAREAQAKLLRIKQVYFPNRA